MSCPARYQALLGTARPRSSASPYPRGLVSVRLRGRASRECGPRQSLGPNMKNLVRSDPIHRVVCKESPLMTLDDRILDLLLRWEELGEQGQPITPEQLCQDSPELLDEIKKRIQDLGRVSSLVSTVNETGGADS